MFGQALNDHLHSVNWFKDAIIYHILIDRFAGYDQQADPLKPDFIGGHLKGITEKLPYLIDLGINTLWLSPVYCTTAYHGYHITDFFHTDERFGTTDDLKELIREAHRNNIRVLLDFVPNHCSDRHPYFISARQDRKSKYRKWFYFNRFTNSHLSFLHFNELPKLNLDEHDARNHIIGAAKYWISLGIDGFRLDHAVGPSHHFWKAFNAEIKSVNAEAVLIGEAWLEGVGIRTLKTIGIKRKYLRWLMQIKPWSIQQEYIGELDGVLDFYFRHRITEFIAWKDNPDDYMHDLGKIMEDHYKSFPEGFYLPAFIDNHDMNRFLFDTGQDREKLKKALEFQFSLPQPVILYYGTETGLSHNKEVKWDVPFSDIYARQPMPWDHLDKDLIGFCKELIRNRKLKSNE
jgi:cyclomaltodextrinase